MVPGHPEKFSSQVSGDPKFLFPGYAQSILYSGAPGVYCTRVLVQHNVPIKYCTQVPPEHICTRVRPEYFLPWYLQSVLYPYISRADCALVSVESVVSRYPEHTVSGHLQCILYPGNRGVYCTRVPLEYKLPGYPQSTLYLGTTRVYCTGSPPEYVVPEQPKRILCSSTPRARCTPVLPDYSVPGYSQCEVYPRTALCIIPGYPQEIFYPGIPCLYRTWVRPEFIVPGYPHSVSYPGTPRVYCAWIPRAHYTRYVLCTLYPGTRRALITRDNIFSPRHARV